MGDTPVEPGLDLSAFQLDVYQSRDGGWHPEHGEVLPPQGWEFLPTGEAFVTRTVKVAGVLVGLGAAQQDPSASSAPGAVGPGSHDPERGAGRWTPPRRGRCGARLVPGAGNGKRPATRTS